VPRSGKRAARGVLLSLIVASFLGATPALADRVTDLSTTLEHSGDEKARISAAIALGRLADSRGVPALVKALDDSSASVRSVAASALGHIADPSAIPALERVASADAVDSVRKSARTALEACNARKAELDAAAAKTVAPPPPPPAPTRLRVAVNPMTAKGKGGKEMAAKLHENVIALLGDNAGLSVETASTAPEIVLDGSVVKLSRTSSGPYVEVSCEIKLTVSAGDGRMLSMVTGSATVRTAKRSYKEANRRILELQALEGAVDATRDKLFAFLARQVTSSSSSSRER
jgi:hypothetical protein